MTGGALATGGSVVRAARPVSEGTFQRHIFLANRKAVFENVPAEMILVEMDIKIASIKRGEWRGNGPPQIVNMSQAIVSETRGLRLMRRQTGR